MIEWLCESLWCTFIIIINVLIWVLIGGFFINLWEISLEWWNKRFNKIRKYELAIRRLEE